MALYFFDIDDGTMQRDEEGSEYPTLNAAQQAAKRLLPSLARDELPRDGDEHTYTLLVSDAERRPVYRATLSFIGSSLIPYVMVVQRKRVMDGEHQPQRRFGPL
jgi:hypothetical protein